MIKTILEDYEAKEENINIGDEYDKIFRNSKRLSEKSYFPWTMEQYKTHNF